jgi:hypothetical protein
MLPKAGGVFINTKFRGLLSSTWDHFCALFLLPCFYCSVVGAMGKKTKKFIDKKKAATFRLVFKDSSDLSYGDGDGHDRTFARVDGGHIHVPGFDDDERDDSIFEDADEEEEEGEEGEGEEGGEGRNRNRPSRIPSNSSSSAAAARQELIELGFPDDGYNYLQHLREIGPPGRIGSFVPNNSLRLDLLRPDVKVCVSCTYVLHVVGVALHLEYYTFPCHEFLHRECFGYTVNLFFPVSCNEFAIEDFSDVMLRLTHFAWL